MERKPKLPDALVWSPVVNLSCVRILSLMYICVLNLPFHPSSVAPQSSATREL